MEAIKLFNITFVDWPIVSTGAWLILIAYVLLLILFKLEPFSLSSLIFFMNRILSNATYILKSRITKHIMLNLNI